LKAAGFDVGPNQLGVAWVGAGDEVLQVG
jgi:hypothetical protein